MIFKNIQFVEEKKKYQTSADILRESSMASRDCQISKKKSFFASKTALFKNKKISVTFSSQSWSGGFLVVRGYFSRLYV